MLRWVYSAPEKSKRTPASPPFHTFLYIAWRSCQTWPSPGHQRARANMAKYMHVHLKPSINANQEAQGNLHNLAKRVHTFLMCFFFFRGEVGFGLAPIDFSFVFIDFPWFHEALTSVDQIFPGFMGFAKACINFATGFSSTLRCLSLIFPPIASNCHGFHWFVACLNSFRSYFHQLLNGFIGLQWLSLHGSQWFSSCLQCWAPETSDVHGPCGHVGWGTASLGVNAFIL